MIEVRFEARAGVTASWVRRVVQKTLLAEKSAVRSLSVLVTGDRRIRRINKQFLKHDYATDVISFGLNEKNTLGEVVVSVDTARRVSKDLKIPFREELARYLVHGTLHLLGHDDRKKKDFEKMHYRQEKILNSL